MMSQSSIITDWDGISLVPVHPGEILEEEFLRPLGLSGAALARALHIPANRVNDIVRGRRSVTADTALRLARYFATTPEFWLNLQLNHDLAVARGTSAAQISITVIPRASR